MHTRHFSILTLVLLLTMPGTIVAQTAPFARTTIVSPGGTPQTSGTNLLTALASVNGTSSAPWLLKIEPGIYDLGSSRLEMKSWVDIEGSSVGTTFIEGDGPSGTSDAILKGANDSEIRNLTIRCVGTTGCRAIVNSSGASSVRDLHISANLANGSITGIRNEGQSPTIDNVVIDLEGGTGDIRGVVNVSAGGIDSRTTLKRVQILINNTASTATAAGVWSEGESGLQRLEDSQISVKDGAMAAGILVVNPVPLTSARTLYPVLDTNIFVQDATTNFGIKDSFFDIRVVRSRIRAFGVGSIGITSENATIEVKNSEITGDAATIIANIAVVGISQLNGGPLQANTENCGLVVDENYAPFPNLCP